MKSASQAGNYQTTWASRWGLTAITALSLIAAIPADASKQNAAHPRRRTHSHAKAQKAGDPLSQTVRGLTLKIVNTHWEPETTSQPTPMLLRKSLAFNYRLTASDNKEAPKDGNWAPYLDHFDLFKSDGHRIESNSFSNQTQSLSFQIDPHEKRAYLELTFRDVNATPSDTGVNDSAVEFSALPVPHKPGQIFEINQEKTTPWGARVRLEKIGIPETSKYSNDVNTPHGFTIVYKVIPPPNTPDFTFGPQPTKGITIIDDTGDELSSPTHGGYDVSDDDTFTRERTSQSISYNTLPTEKANKVSINFSFRESSMRARKASAYRQFRYALNLEGLVNPPISFPVLTPTPSRGQYVDATVETFQRFGSMFNIRLLTKDREGVVGRHWNTHEIEMQDDAGNVYHLTPSISPYYWTQEGKAISPTEYGTEFQFPAASLKGAPKTCSLKFLLTGARTEEHHWDFRKIAIPRENERTILNKTVTDNGVAMNLQDIVLYTPGSPLSETRLLSWSAAGIALSVQIDDQNEGNYSGVAANSSDGYHLQIVGPSPGSLEEFDDRRVNTNAISTRDSMLFFLSLPPAASKSLNLRFEKSEERSLDLDDEVGFTNISIPTGSDSH